MKSREIIEQIENIAKNTKDEDIKLRALAFLYKAPYDDKFYALTEKFCFKENDTSSGLLSLPELLKGDI